MFCTNCGCSLPDDAKFCTNCGAILDFEEDNVLNLEVSIEETESIENINESKKTNFSNQSSATTKLNKNTKVKIITVTSIAFVLIVSLLIGISYVTSPTRKMEKALNTKNISEVIILYDSAQNQRTKNKYDKVIADYLDDVYETLNIIEHTTEEIVNGNGNEVLINDIKDKWGNLIFSTETTTLSYCISASNNEKWALLMSLLDSKCNYYSAVYCKENGNIDEAIDHYAQVTEEDYCYDDATQGISDCIEMYVQSVLVEADTLVSNGDIDGALQKLESINTYLRDKGLESDEINQKINETKATYAQTYADKAQTAFNEHDVNAAIGNIQVAIQLAPDNVDYQSKYDTYQQYLPFALYDFDNVITHDINTSEANVDFDITKTANDNTEKIHSIDLFYSSGFWADPSGVLCNFIYNFNGNYDSVTGVMFIPDTYKSREQTAYFEAYGDGKLLYTSPTFSPGVLPQNIEFGVSGVHKFEIIFYGETSETWGASVAVSNLVAQKNFPESEGE